MGGGVRGEGDWAALTLIPIPYSLSPIPYPLVPIPYPLSSYLIGR